MLGGVYASESVNVGSKDSLSACNCDITQNSCDFMCCCDPDCGSSLLNYWNSYCTSPITQCSSKFSKTLEGGWRSMKVATDVINRVLCVSIDNSLPSLNYFPVLSAGSSGRNYNTASLTLSSEISISTANTFTTNQYLSANLSGSQYIWTLPTPDAYGYCTYSFPIQWLVSIPLTTCILIFNPSTNCSNLNINNFGSSLKISSSISPSIKNVYLRIEGQPDVLITSYSTQASGCSCTNAVIEAHYSIYSKSQTSIDSISVDLVVTNLNSCGTVYLNQSYSLNFFTNSSNVVPRSGNPGYQIGKKLITGYMNSSTQITYYENGFQIPGINNDGSCGTNTIANSPYILFGRDSIYSCSVSYSFSDLSNICQSSSLPTPVLFFDQNLLTLIGKYGNINFAYSDDWVVVTNLTSSPYIKFFTDTGICYLPNMLNYYIVYTSIGNVLNPQFKVIYAEREYTSSTYWQFKLSDKTQKQKFYYTVTINYVEYTKIISSYFPPAPNPLPTMPDDIIYPFKISSAEEIFTTLIVLLVCNLI